jgi:hypothetical protein
MPWPSRSASATTTNPSPARPAGAGCTRCRSAKRARPRILIAELRRQYPGIPILLTHGTATGREEGAKLLEPGDLQVWQPWDTPGAVARFLDRFKPRIGVLMETEVWPEMAAACAERRIPLVLANARLNEKSLAAAERLGWLARPAYSALAAVWAQTEADAHRLVSLGAKVAGVYGNLKFDASPDARQLTAAPSLRERLPAHGRAREFARRRGAAAARRAQALRRHLAACRPSRARHPLDRQARARRCNG